MNDIVHNLQLLREEKMFSLYDTLRAFEIVPSKSILGYVLTSYLSKQDRGRFGLASKKTYKVYGKSLWREKCPICGRLVSYAEKKRFTSSVRRAIKNQDRLPTLDCEGSKACCNTLQIYGHLEYSSKGPTFKYQMFTAFRPSCLEWYNFVDETARLSFVATIKSWKHQ